MRGGGEGVGEGKGEGEDEGDVCGVKGRGEGGYVVGRSVRLLRGQLVIMPPPPTPTPKPKPKTKPKPKPDLRPACPRSPSPLLRLRHQAARLRHPA